MVQEVEQALRLQEFDKRISELTNEIAALPKHVATIEKQLAKPRSRRSPS
jgi:hypothetical protein